MCCFTEWQLASSDIPSHIPCEATSQWAGLLAVQKEVWDTDLTSDCFMVFRRDACVCVWLGCQHTMKSAICELCTVAHPPSRSHTLCQTPHPRLAGRLYTLVATPCSRYNHLDRFHISIYKDLLFTALCITGTIIQSQFVCVGIYTDQREWLSRTILQTHFLQGTCTLAR